MEKLKVFECFAGIGCQSIALRNLNINYEVVGISEVDRYALLSYDVIHNKQIDIELPTKEEMLKEFEDKHIAYNFSTGKSEIPRKIEDIEKLYKAHIRSKNYGDIRLINPDKLPLFDLFTYSYPCKNISVAGKKEGLENGSNTQSSLVWECFKIIEYCKPKYLLMENVKNLVGKKFKPYFNEICDSLNRLGYNNYYKVLNAKDYGIPQNRERVIMISIRKDIDKSYEFPKRKTYPNIENFLEKDIKNRYYNFNDVVMIDKKIKPSVKINIEKNAYDIINAKEGIIFSCECKSGWQDNRIGINISPTLRALNSHTCIYCNGKISKLTPLEYWRLMGLSDEDFNKVKKIGLSDVKLYERAGRGIVVPMLESVFKNLF